MGASHFVATTKPYKLYDPKASQIAHYAVDNDLTLKEAALKLAFVTEADFDCIVDPGTTVHPYASNPI